MANIIKKDDGRQASFGSVVDQLFHHDLNRWFNDEFWGFNGMQTRSTVPVNIRETDKSYEVEVMAPGLKKEDFQLQLSGDTLTISFEHKEESKTGGENDRWLRREYRAQSFSRSFNVDETVDVDKAKARYENGVLYLSIPRKENAQKISKTINVQ
jgi:HSP20 family protein